MTALDALLRAPYTDMVQVNDDCWLWQGQVGTSGYGRVRVGPKHGLAHRVIYEARVGPIPEGLTIDHLCAHPTCVNPAHMEVVSVGENLRRRWDRTGRAERCPRGHEYVMQGNRKRCPTCEIPAVVERNRARRLAGREPSVHGLGGYTNYGCRCVTCAKAMRDYKRKWKAARP